MEWLPVFLALFGVAFGPPGLVAMILALSIDHAEIRARRRSTRLLEARTTVPHYDPPSGITGSADRRSSAGVEGDPSRHRGRWMRAKDLAASERSHRLLSSFVITFFGITWPVWSFCGFMVFGVMWDPESKIEARDGWVDCLSGASPAVLPLVVWAAVAFWCSWWSFPRSRRTTPFVVFGLAAGALVALLQATWLLTSAAIVAIPFNLSPFIVAVWYGRRAWSIGHNKPPRLAAWIASLLIVAFFIAMQIWEAVETYRFLPEA